MRSKVQWAGAIALAATVFTVLMSAQGSGAVASDLIPVPGQEAAPSKVAFVSNPVVQPLPGVSGQGAADDQEASPAASLAQLVAQQPATQGLSRDMRCLAGAIYFESRGETLEGQLAVGRVIINRAQSGRFPASYCGVVYQPSQFSFVHGRSMPIIRENSADWRQAVAIARIAQEDSWTTPAKGALFFHAARVSPGWRLTRLAQVDNHIFYR